MRLVLEYAADCKIREYTEQCPNEISGLGKVRIEGEDIIVSDVAIFKQRVSAAHSTIEPSALAEFQCERVKAGESMKDWCLWWHSHADMAVFFSGTDTGTIDTSTEFPYLASLVVNKKGESKARVDVFSPVRMTESMEVVVQYPEAEGIAEEVKREIAAKVTHPEYKTGFAERRSGKDAVADAIGVPRPYSSAHDIIYGNDFRDDDAPDYNSPSFDADMAMEYAEHRKYLLDRLQVARTLRDKELVATVTAELQEWESWGAGMGLGKGVTVTL